MKNFTLLFLACFIILSIAGCSKKSIPLPVNNTTSTASLAQVPQSDIYEVTVIRSNGNREKQIVFQNACPQYLAGDMGMQTKDQYPLNLFKNRTINWTTFSFSGSVGIEVRLLNHNRITMTSNVKILPSRYGITPVVNGDVISFSLTNPGQCSVEIGDNGYKNGLMIFANPPETDKPDTTTAAYKVLTNASVQDISNISQPGIYFKAGVQNIGVYHVPLNVKNIYFEEGSFVYGSLIMDGNPNVKIFGRGVLSSAKLNYRQSHCIEAINQSDNITVQGITIADPKYFALRLIGKNNHVDWVKVIGGWTYNCDGIAAFEGSTVSHCFIWANDDNIKVYRNNISFSDCVCWQLNNGGVIQLSWGNGNSTGVTISRIDILHAEWNSDEVNRGVISCVGDKFAAGGMYGLQANWVIDDLVTETTVPLIFRISPNPASPNEIHGMVFKNWNVKMDMTNGFNNYIVGTDSTHKFDGLVFDHFIFNGTTFTSSNWISLSRMVVNNIEPPVFY
jgi:hypothetical protein